MYALELETEVDENNEIHLKLPEQYPKKHAKVIVLMDVAAQKARKRTPSPRLANQGAKWYGDELQPAFDNGDWNDLFADGKQL